MPSYLVQAGTGLNRVTQSGAVAALTLPAGVTLTGPSQMCRSAIFSASSTPIRVVVNGGTKDMWFDQYDNPYLLQIVPPIAAPTVTTGASTGLTGTYAVAVTFKVKDANGMVLFESAQGPTSAYSSALSNQSLRLNSIPVSQDAGINCRGIYRTTSGGNILYPWFDIDDNVSLSEDRAGADALLSLLPSEADTFGSPPLLALIAVWKNRLWGVPRYKPDALRWTEERIFYAWNESNEFIIPPQNSDDTGVTAIIPRRDQLGIARTDRLHQITGNDNDSFQQIEVSPTLGCVSQESVVVVQDTAYFLSERGVVEWNNGGIGLVSEAQVDSWFTNDDTFNRTLFNKAQGRYNRSTDSYELLLASAGSTVLDTWVAFDLKGRRWFGPHKSLLPIAVTGQATDRSGDWRVASTGAPLHKSVFGTLDGYLFARDENNHNDGPWPVSFVAKLPFLDGGNSDFLTNWGELSVQTQPQSTGTLTITPTVGELTAAPLPPLTHDLRVERERLTTLGEGRYMQLTLTHNAKDEGLRIYQMDLPYSLTDRG